jgi:hypothetical protein
MKEEKRVSADTSPDNPGEKNIPRVYDEWATYRAMFRRVRRPLRAPLAGSSVLGRTRSIFDMTLTQGISRLTMADMADKTPLCHKPVLSVIDGLENAGLAELGHRACHSAQARENDRAVYARK